MSKFIVSPRAKVDIKQIGRYTQKIWGLKQRDKYLSELEKRFEWLVDNKYMGVHCPEIKEGYFSFPHEKHKIFYTISNNGNINIIGVIGAGQSFEKYFS